MKNENTAVVITGPVALESITLGGNLDVHDVVTVITSKHEEHYTNNMKRCQKEMKAAEKAKDALVSTMRTQMTEEATAVTPAVTRLEKALTAFGGTMKFSANVNYLTATNMLEAAIIVVNPKADKQISFTVETKPSKELKQMHAEVDALSQQYTALQAEAVAWKAKLGTIPALERKLKARIAEKKLETMEGGKALIAMLGQDLDTEMALPQLN